MIKLKNDRERMGYVKDQDNWEPNYIDLIETRMMQVGFRLFVRIVGKIKGEYDLTPKINTVDQFEVMKDKEGFCLEHRSNDDIVKAIRECK